MSTSTISRPILRLAPRPTSAPTATPKPAAAPAAAPPRPAAPAGTSRRTIPRLDDARLAARVATLARLRELAPVVFDVDNPRPLKIGVHRDLVALGIAADAVRDAMQWWACQPAYRRAVAAGGSRYDLHGAVVGTVTTQQMEAAMT